MCAFFEGLVPPDFGMTLKRQRLIDAFFAEGNRPCAIFGHSGVGKSILAAHIAQSVDARAIWIDAGGRPLTALSVVRSVLGSIQDFRDAAGIENVDDEAPLCAMRDEISRILRFSLPKTRVCLVVDDLGELTDPNAVEELSQVGKTLWHCGSRMIVTTRTLVGWPSRTLREWGLVGPDVLRLTVQEAEQLLELMGSDGVEAETVVDTCGGHLAFFVLLARQASSPASATHGPSSKSLNTLIEYVVEGLDETQRLMLFRAACLRTGSLQDLRMSDRPHLVENAEELSVALPLFKLTRNAGVASCFRVHDAIDAYWSSLGVSKALLTPFLADSVMQLTLRGDELRALELLMRWGGEDELLEWLVCHGRSLLAQEQHSVVEGAIESISVGTLVKSPGLLLLWGELLAGTGRLEDGLAKCRAAKALAEHINDASMAKEAVALSLVCLRGLYRMSEADKLAEEVIARCSAEDDPRLLAQALVNLGYNQIVRGEMSDARKTVQSACDVSDSLDSSDWVSIAARQVRALIAATADGDFVAMDRQMAPLQSLKSHINSGITIRGNIALALLELGRLARCEALLSAALRDARARGILDFIAAYLPSLGCVTAARGRATEGVGMISEAIAIGVEARDEPSVAQARVYLAIVLRAAGDLDGSLVEAEQAFESLAASDYMSFSRLATLEVAASLLALGDLSAARSWAEGVVERGFAGNRYHALRAAMILAEIERREGHEAEALAQLSTQADYVLSENANWQIGMYCRAFPALLGLLTKTIGAARLPAHLIRIVLPEYAERALLECHDMLGEAEWRALGTRLLGDSEFEKLVARNGQPLCRVRLFGGLEVSIGGRAIQERDWKKRKVRLLFIMLVSRRGHDVPRDQICERLWPEMDEKQATSNFYVTWSLMKSALGAGTDKNKPSPYVESVGGLCRVARAVVSSDIDEFEENLKRAREAEASGDTEAALRCYQRIADIYRGHLLPGDCYDDWFADLRAYYRTEFVDAMLGASGILAASRDRSNALVYLRRAIQADPHREDLYQRAMRSQIDAGMRSAAIETYFQCRERISDELGLDPSIETQGLYREILAMESRPISLAEDIPLC